MNQDQKNRTKPIQPNKYSKGSQIWICVLKLVVTLVVIIQKCVWIDLGDHEFPTKITSRNQVKTTYATEIIDVFPRYSFIGKISFCTQSYWQMITQQNSVVDRFPLLPINFDANIFQLSFGIKIRKMFQLAARTSHHSKFNELWM